VPITYIIFMTQAVVKVFGSSNQSVQFRKPHGRLGTQKLLDLLTKWRRGAVVPSLKNELFSNMSANNFNWYSCLVLATCLVMATCFCSEIEQLSDQYKEMFCDRNSTWCLAVELFEVILFLVHSVNTGVFVSILFHTCCLCCLQVSTKHHNNAIAKPFQYLFCFTSHQN
jgi:hypothetical protein